MLLKKPLVVIAILFGQCMFCLLASPVLQKLQRAFPTSTIASELQLEIQPSSLQPLPPFSEILADVKNNFVINALSPDAKALNPPHASSSFSSIRDDNDRDAFVSKPVDFSAKRSKRITSHIKAHDVVKSIGSTTNDAGNISNEIASYDRRQRQMFSSLSDKIFTNLAANNKFVNLTLSMPQSVLSDKNLPIYQFPFVMVKSGGSPRNSSNLTLNTLKIYGEGTESKFPPFLEHFVQRIQHYFSVYKYEDLSRPALSSGADMGQVIPELLDGEEHVGLDSAPEEMIIFGDDIDASSSETLIAPETTSLTEINENVVADKLYVSTKIATPEDYVITERVPIVVADEVKGEESTSDIKTAGENEVDVAVV